MTREPTAAQMNCGHALYGPPAFCTCGTCGTCNYCGGEGVVGDYVGLEMNCVAANCPVCEGSGKLQSAISRAEAT